MADLTPAQQTGLSNATQSVRTSTPNASLTKLPRSPEQQYMSYRNDMGPTIFKSFPPDAPDMKVVIAGRDYDFNAGGAVFSVGNSRLIMGYVLPIPQIKLIDRYQVSYDDSFSFLSSLTKGALTESNAARVIAGVTGVRLNDYKSVLMQSPLLKRHEFIWKLSPKNEAESRLIVDIVNGFKIGAAPPMWERQGSIVLSFPLIWDLYFEPHFPWMYGFKPCVIESIDVDYAGGNPQPSHYFNGAPESVTLNINFLEIEIWNRLDYQNWQSNNSISSPPNGRNPTQTITRTNAQNVPESLRNLIRTGSASGDTTGIGTPRR